MTNRLKEIRESRNMTQEELAEKSGVGRVTISGIENNSDRPTTTRTLLALASALDVPITEIFFLP